MKLVNYQEIIAEKIKRQKSIPQLEYHAAGHAVHIGKISPGCRGCLSPEPSIGIQIGTQCMFRCPYCYYDPKRPKHTLEQINFWLAEFRRKTVNPNWRPNIFSFQSSGETLMYLDQLERFAKLIKEMEKERGGNFYLYVYTNGVLADSKNLERLKNWGVREIRFHTAASNFSEQVYKNIERAIEYGFTATVELPSLPHYRDKVFEMLPIINSLGVKHLNLLECQVTIHNVNALHQLYPNGRMHQGYFIHLYDEGLVYDIIEEVIVKGYNFSVLDCNSGVENCRHGEGRYVFFNMDSIKGMCDEWDYYGKTKLDCPI